MKTFRNTLVAIILFMVSVGTVFNSNTATMLTGGTCDIYLAATDSDAYKTLFQGYNTGENLVL